MVQPMYFTLTEKLEASFWARVAVRGPDECWEWAGLSGTARYGKVVLPGTRKTVPATHVALAIDGRPRQDQPHGSLACHTCDNPPCVNPAHLWWGALSDNALDAVAKGRWVKNQGSRHGMTRLSEEDALKILTSKEPAALLAASFQVHKTTVERIRSRRAWAHLSAAIPRQEPAA